MNSKDKAKLVLLESLMFSEEDNFDVPKSSESSKRIEQKFWEKVHMAKEIESIFAEFSNTELNYRYIPQNNNHFEGCLQDSVTNNVYAQEEMSAGMRSGNNIEPGYESFILGNIGRLFIHFNHKVIFSFTEKIRKYFDEIVLQNKENTYRKNMTEEKISFDNIASGNYDVVLYKQDKEKKVFSNIHFDFPDIVEWQCQNKNTIQHEDRTIELLYLSSKELKVEVDGFPENTNVQVFYKNTPLNLITQMGIQYLFSFEAKNSAYNVVTHVVGNKITISLR